MRKQKFYYLAEYNISTDNCFGFYSSPEKIVEDLYKTYKCKFHYTNHYTGYEFLKNHFSTYLTNEQMIKIMLNMLVDERFLVSIIMENKSFSDLIITKCKINSLTHKRIVR